MLSDTDTMIKWLQLTAIAVSDVCNSIMFWVFSNSKWIERFNAGPYKFFLFPAIAMSALLNAIIELYHLYNAPNKNVLNVSSFISTLIGSIGSVTANAGAIIAALCFHAAFPLGIYFILMGVSVGLLFNFSQSIIHIIGYHQTGLSLKSRLQYKQNATFHLFYSAMLLSIFFALTFTMLVPTTTIFPMLAIVFFAADLLWSVILPAPAKQWLQHLCGFVAPLNDIALNKDAPPITPNHSKISSPTHFFQPQRREEQVTAFINKDKKSDSTVYLLKEVSIKKKHIENKLIHTPHDLKHAHKLTVINAIDTYLKGKENLTESKLNDLCKKHYLSRQSFFSMAQGDMGDIIQATQLHISHS